MPIVEFSEDDLKRGVIVTPAWYRMLIVEVGEKLSKDQGSTNYPVEGRIIKNAEDGSTAFAGVPITWNFNSKAMGFSRGFLSALGVAVEAHKRYDLAAAKGMEIEVFVENGTYEGRLVNRVEHKYRKVGAGGESPE
jgi:hypothetical protein